MKKGKVYIIAIFSIFVIILALVFLDLIDIGSMIGLSTNYDWLSFIGSCTGIVVAICVPLYVLDKTMEGEKAVRIRNEKWNTCMGIIADISELISLHKQACYYSKKYRKQDADIDSKRNFWQKHSFIKMKLSALKYSELYSGTEELVEELEEYVKPMDLITHNELQGVVELFVFEPSALMANDSGLIKSVEKFVEKNTM